MVKTARVLGLLAVWIAWSWGPMALPVFAQRVQFPTPVDPSSPGSTAITPATPYAQPVGPSPYAAPTAPPLQPMPSTAPNPAASPYVGPIPGGTSAPAPGAPPPTYTPSPGFAAPAVAPGAVTQPPPNWDPYATPGGAPGSLLPQDPYLQCGPGISMATAQKFLQHIDLNYDWFAGHGVNELGINDVNLSATFAFPLFFNSQTPLLVTPGFAVHYWEGPVSVAAAPAAMPADMPPQTFDGYLDAAWNPKVTEYFGGELEARIGIYSDFYSVVSNSLRLTGKGMAVIKLSPHMTLKAGIWYLNRVNVKLLPAGGLVWTPNPDIYFDILFPNPKVAKRLTTWGNTEWWLYGRGEYGGGVWTIRRNPA